MGAMSPPIRYLPALVAMALILTACSAGDGGSSPSRLASAAVSSSSSSPTESSPQPSIPPADDWVAPVLEPPSGILPPGSVAVVTVDGLRMRNGHPGMDPLDDQIVQTLDTGALVTVAWSPFAYLAADQSPDGRAWYEVHAGGRAVSGGEIARGWVAAGDTGLDFLRIEPVLCPAEVNLEVLLWTPAHNEEPEGMTTAWDRLACVGSRSLELEGVFETCYEGGLYPYTFDPAYLAAPGNCASLMLDDIDGSGRTSKGGSLPIGIPPALASVPLERGDVVRITGHFDDPASATCTATPAGDFESRVDPTFLALFCRERLVVDELEVIGHRELAPLP